MDYYNWHVFGCVVRVWHCCWGTSYHLTNYISACLYWFWLAASFFQRNYLSVENCWVFALYSLKNGDNIMVSHSLSHVLVISLILQLLPCFISHTLDTFNIWCLVLNPSRPKKMVFPSQNIRRLTINLPQDSR